MNNDKVFNLFKGFKIQYNPDYEIEEGGKG